MTFPINWQLDELGPRPGEVEFDHWLQAIQANLEQFEKKVTDRLGQGISELESGLTSEQLAELVEQYGSAAADWSQAVSLVGCYASDESENEQYRKAEGAVAAIYPQLARADHALDRLLKQIPGEQWSEFANASVLQPVFPFLERRRNEASLRLPDQLADFAGDLNVDGLQGWSRLYDELSAAVRISVMERGELVEKSPGQIAFDSPERTDRENKFFSSQRAWNSIAEPCAAALNHLVGSRLTLDRYANRKNYLAIPYSQNRVTSRSIEQMWEAITNCKADLVRYLRAKQRLLKLESICWYDLDAPLPSNSSSVDYQSACEIILETFAAFHPPLKEFAEQALRSGWVEAEDRPGKRQGGFCTDFPPSKQTRIFMTHRGTEDGLSTLAHELGHAYHTWVLRNEPVVMQSYPMTLAETASTFAETVVAEQRIETCVDKQNRLAALDRQLQDAVSFLMNIHCRFIFDNEIHTRRPQGELSAGELSELMVAAQKQAYAGILDEAGWNPTFWISKLHFYISDEPFYNFPYTFGYLLSQRLYLEARNDPGGFPASYDQFLIATTGVSAIAAAKESFGFDLESIEFWNEALQPIRDRVESFVAVSQEMQ